MILMFPFGIVHHKVENTNKNLNTMTVEIKLFFLIILRIFLLLQATSLYLFEKLSVHKASVMLNKSL